MRRLKLFMLLTAMFATTIAALACDAEPAPTPTSIPTATAAIQLASGRSSDSVTPTPTSVPTATARTPMNTPQSPAGPPDGPPIGDLDTSKTYTATFKIESGEFKVELFDDDAPLTVENFVKLARSGYYDGTTFHRVLQGFMAQGGDPTATGSGGPGYRFKDEFSDRAHDSPGVLSMANSGPGTNGSQFFITFVPTPHLNGKHTVFGKVVEGLDVALNIRLRDPNTDVRPGEKIQTIEIDES